MCSSLGLTCSVSRPACGWLCLGLSYSVTSLKWPSLTIDLKSSPILVTSVISLFLHITYHSLKLSHTCLSPSLGCELQESRAMSLLLTVGPCHPPQCLVHSRHSVDIGWIKGRMNGRVDRITDEPQIASCFVAS